MNDNLTPTESRRVAGWYGPNGETYLSTWIGLTKTCVVIGPKHRDPMLGWKELKFFEFKKQLGFDEELKIANELGGTLVICVTGQHCNDIGKECGPQWDSCSEFNSQNKLIKKEVYCLRCGKKKE